MREPFHVERRVTDRLLEERPGVAEEIFGRRSDLATRFVEHLASTGIERGLLGPRELPRLWTRHVLNCAVVAELLPAGADVVDVGSGAGLPGIALSLARPDVHVTLVEPLERRVAWLQEVVDDLGLPVRIMRARAEDLAGEVRAPVVTARAVAGLPRLLEWGLPLVAPDGVLLAIKGRSAGKELAAATPALRRFRADSWDVVECGVSLTVPTTVVRVRVGREPVTLGGQRSHRRAARKDRR